MTLGAGLLRLVCFQGNINALADIVQLGNLGAGFFQLGIFRCSLPAEGGVLFFPFSDKYEEAHRAELTLWNAASRYLHAHLPEGVKTLPISAWEKEYAALKAQRETEYAKLKGTRSDLSELQNIRRCVDIALRADQPEQTQTHTKRHDIDR